MDKTNILDGQYYVENIDNETISFVNLDNMIIICYKSIYYTIFTCSYVSSPTF